jgi:hypothetical protein
MCLFFVLFFSIYSDLLFVKTTHVWPCTRKTQKPMNDEESISFRIKSMTLCGIIDKEKRHPL